MPENACVKTEGDHSAIYWSERVEDGAMGQLLILTHKHIDPEISSRVRFDSLIQKIVFSKVNENVMWCLEIPDPKTPSNLKVTQFLVRDRGLKIYDDFLVQMKASVVECGFSPNEEKLIFGCSDNTLVLLDTKTKSVEQVALSIRPNFLCWHPLW